jgi:hypothetical protein
VENKNKPNLLKLELEIEELERQIDPLSLCNSIDCGGAAMAKGGVLQTKK